MNLRIHQSDLWDHVRQIRDAKDLRTILATVTPGGGKSLLPVLLVRGLIPRLADRIAWVVPRLALQEQAERAFLDPGPREALGHRARIRAAGNELDPARGCEGYATTYQAIVADPELHAREFARRRYVLFLDEFHHVEEGGRFHEALRLLVDRAALLVLVTGTLERGDGKRIAFLPYREAEAKRVTPDLGDPGLHVIRYSRRQALEERAIVPVQFHQADGNAEWEDRDGRQQAVDSLAAAGKLAAPALYTALRTEYAEHLLDDCLASWREERARNPRAKMLVVVSAIEQAARLMDLLKERRVPALQATSDESAAAADAIRRFKRGSGPGAVHVLVTVAMAYEGLDVPPVTHIACLTNIRSRPWIEQMVARATRVDHGGLPYEGQRAHVFCPDDPLMQECIDALVQEQAPFVKTPEPKAAVVQLGLFGDELEPPRGIRPLASQKTGHRRTEVGTVVERLRVEQAFSVWPVEVIQPGQADVLTPSQEEDRLRREISSYCRRYEHASKMEWGSTSRRIAGQFGKSRTAMTLDELQAVHEWLLANYPLASGGVRNV